MRHFALVSSIAVALPLSLAPLAGSASVIGYLGNFDVINDTGTTAHGFEIELEDLHLSDITDTFGGAGRGFPSGRGFDPNVAVQRYGAPTIEEYFNGGLFAGTRVTYRGLFDGTGWDYGTPSGNFVTPGDNCWTRGGVGYGSATPCDHFGVGTRKAATKTTYSWLLETAPDSNLLSKGGVVLPAPVMNVVAAPLPPPGQPPAPPVVEARIEAPAPPNEAQFGDAIWVKVFTTELPDPIELEDLVADNQKVKGAVTEVEWQLLQKDPGNPLSGVLEKGYGVPVGPDAASILRRYEFFKFSGAYKPEDHEATFAEGYGDSNPLIILDLDGKIVGGDVGTYLGAQNVAVNLAAAVPEPESYAMLLAGLGLIGAIARRRRQRAA